MIYLFSSKIYNPLQKLAVKAGDISNGDFSSEIAIGSADSTVTFLAETINTMSEDISSMMKDLKTKADAEEKLLVEKNKNLEYEARLNNAMLKVLQTQTNPHFLFNTLNSISRTITLGKPEIAQSMLSSLSALMRYNLTDGDEPAALREEVEITEEYLKIQKLRFDKRLCYKISISDDLLDSVSLPRFTLQPLVENSIIHGLSPLKDGGTIFIDAKERKSGIILRITDNGVGMTQDKLNEIRSHQNNRIGLENTRKRMELFYTKQNVIEVISKENKGTMIILHLENSWYV